MRFAEHRVYVVIVLEAFPREVVTIFGTPPSFSTSRTAGGSVEVMMAGSVENRHPPLERNVDGRATNLRLPNPDLINSSIEHLRNHITPIEADPAAAAAALETTRQNLLEEAIKVVVAQWRMNATMREYNIVHGFVRLPSTSHLDQPPGRNLGSEMDCVADPRTPAVQPVYSTPAKNMRAAEAAVVELSHLEGEELLHQQARV